MLSGQSCIFLISISSQFCRFCTESEPQTIARALRSVGEEMHEQNGVKKWYYVDLLPMHSIIEQCMHSNSNWIFDWQQCQAFGIRKKANGKAFVALNKMKRRCPTFFFQTKNGHDQSQSCNGESYKMCSSKGLRFREAKMAFLFSFSRRSRFPG